jgi:hypothetical protein
MFDPMLFDEFVQHVVERPSPGTENDAVLPRSLDRILRNV